ncbi:hypothetical protein [Nocardioides daeguensis]|uniref:Sensor domain-containing protein n=1 Tax=Nocardioides daeguensis TaxID=908359 RepID=A0ABP6W4R4_9ACTN|nr:hypothetical protein [Nocardioides daeguensis]MBV6727712.1 hypothetical protein [Nocardioides daeguensis]MCR1775184.1 hypothetical protein [Nocardioides daeguensis]
MHQRSTLPAIALLAVAALSALTGCSDDTPVASDPGPATSPTAPATTPAALTDAVLLTDDDTVYSDGADWFRLGTGDEDLDGNGDLAHPCVPDGLTGTGATSVVRADFELRNTSDPSVEVTSDLMVELVAQYADEAAAEAAWSTVNGLLEECADRPEAITDYRALQTRKVDVPGADAVITDSHFGPVPREVDPNGDAAYIMETGVLRRGDRLVLLTSVVVGQDYDFVGGTPVERMLPKASRRLANS